MPQDTAQLDLVSTGVPGLDQILRGGLARNRFYLIEGDPGAGKTTLALQFLLEGRARGEPCMYVTLSETEEELGASATSHGWNLDGIHVLELSHSDSRPGGEFRYTMFHPSEVELGEKTRAVLEVADRVKPARLVVDSLSELRLLSENSLRYRKQVLAYKHHFARRGCTAVFIDDRTGTETDQQLKSIAHGVFSLERTVADFGSIRRRLIVGKLRGGAFMEGYHDFTIRREGIEVFPRVAAIGGAPAVTREETMSGLAGLDAMLGGGLTRGTSTLLLGAAGTGKSTLATQYAIAATGRGARASVFLFEESIASYVHRARSLGIDVEARVDDGSLEVRRVNPAELSPGEFAHEVRKAAARDDRGVIVIDSLSGYINAMPSERYLALHLHELLAFLGDRGITTILVLAQHGLLTAEPRALDASYLADNVIMLRYFETGGEIRQCITVIKKRTGPHERAIRELSLRDGLTVGEPLRGFRGVLTGVPEIVGSGSIDGSLA